MKQRRLLMTLQARRDLDAIVLWYRRELGAAAASKATRSIQAGIRATTRVELASAKRDDLPEGYFRVVAKAHIVIFQVDANTSQIVRILHGARGITAIFEPGEE